MANNNTKAATEPVINREWLSLRQVTEYAAVSERTVRSWMHRPTDALPAVQVGGKVLVRRSEIDAWLERHRVRTIDSVDIHDIVDDLIGKT
jgi:excisionase family DNA binding protein